MRRLRVLFVENSEDDVLLATDELRQAGFDVACRRVETAKALQAALSAGDWDVILCDYWMPSFTGAQALEIYKTVGTDVPFLIVSGSITEEAAVDAMRAGAHDYVLKHNLRRLAPAVERELREAENRRAGRQAEQERGRQAQQLERHVQELYRSNKELERFAYVAAHDLQEPLRIVSTHSQLLERKLQDKLDGDSAAILATMRAAALRMEALIRGLLMYSRAIHDKEDRRELVDVGEIVRQVLQQSLALRIEETGASVTVAELPTVHADQTGLLQVFQNLLSNALKYRHADRPPRIDIAAQRTNEEHVFSVSDNGIGIDEQYFERIFEIFRRLHRDHEYPGAGVGLSVANRIVESHGGHMWVESTPGEGSIFFFTLPVVE